MKIEKIIIENLTSFKGKVVVDFMAEPLRSANLFAITGDTGAGKTTLLDAVCLALYNCAPRLEMAHNLRRDMLTEATGDKHALQPTDVGTFLRKGEKSGNCAVIFTVQDGSRWEATWNIRAKRTGTLDKAVRTLRCLSPKKQDIPEKEIDTVIPQIVGLGYEQFTRTVLLAQNSFASFLRANDKDKATLLEKLTGTQIYATLSQKIFLLKKEAETEVREKESLLGESQRDLIASEELDIVRGEYSLLTAKLTDLRKQQADATAGLRWFAEVERVETLVRQSEEAYDQANKALNAYREEEKALELYDNVSPIKGTHQSIQTLRRNLEDTQANETQLSHDLEVSTANYDAAKLQHQRAVEQLAEAKSLRTDRLPIINQGKELQHKMDMQEHNAHNVWTIYERQHALRQQYEGERDRMQGELDLVEERLIHQREEKQKLSVHQSMFDSYDVVVEKLRVFQEDTIQDAKDADEKVRLQDEADRIKVAALRLEGQLRTAEERTARLAHEIAVQRRNIMGQDGALLQEKQNRLTRRLTLLEGAQTLWHNLTNLYEGLAGARTDVRRKQAEVQQIEKELLVLTTKVETLTEEYNNRHTAFAISNVENIKNLQHNLKKGQPCPVCGSTHHPYHTETEQELGRLKDQIEKDFEDVKERLEIARKQRAETETALIGVQQGIKAINRSVSTMERTLSENEKAWQQYATLDASFHECSPSVNADARHTTLLALLDSTQRDANATAETLDRFNRCRSAIDHLLKEEEEERKEVERLSRVHNEQLQNYNVTIAKANSLAEARKIREARLGYTYQELETTVTLSNWYNDWTDNPDNFRQNLDDLYQSWVALNSAILDDENKEKRLQEQIRGINKSVENTRLSERQSQEDHAREMKVLESFRENFRRIYPTQTPDRELEQLNAQVEQAENAVEQIQTELSRLSEVHTTLLGGQQKLEAFRLNYQEQLRQADTTLHQWLSAYNGMNEVLLPQQLDAIFADRRDWNALRAHLTALRANITQTKAHLNATQSQLLELHRHPDRPQKDDSRAQLQEQLDRSVMECEEKEERYRTIEHRLRAHNNAVERSEQVLGELEQVRENAKHWATLDAIFGSADGDKFRKMAQSFTFSTLVEQANFHLSTLSPRYVLRTLPGTLTLEILDRDLLDTQRYVSSLSGGETFIVSLALALGLASLSSHNLSIGSLFIDEGFGNLDATSLDMVMSALANLENVQGRKVGIISHTDQIRTQIAPQIQVVKSGNGGYSTIEIH